MLGLENDPECFKDVMIDKSHFKRYSRKAIDKIREALKERSIDDIWSEYRGAH